MAAPIAALVYSEQLYPERLLLDLARALQAAGVPLAGVVQRDEAVPGRQRCDMHLDVLGTAVSVPISEFRGNEARGCRLDLAGLSAASAAVMQRLADAKPALLIINKFGKVESEGGGLRPAIGEALSRGIPILIGVPARNVDAWRTFAGDYSEDVASIGGIAAWLKAHGVTPPPSSMWSAADSEASSGCGEPLGD